MTEPAIKQGVDEPGKAEQPARWWLIPRIAAVGMFLAAAAMATMTNSAWPAAWVLALLGAVGVLFGVFRALPHGGAAGTPHLAARNFSLLALGFSVLFLGASI